MQAFIQPTPPAPANTRPKVIFPKSPYEPRKAVGLNILVDDIQFKAHQVELTAACAALERIGDDAAQRLRLEYNKRQMRYTIARNLKLRERAVKTRSEFWASTESAHASRIARSHIRAPLPS